MRVALIQDNPLVGALERNGEMLLARIRAAADEGADLAIAPELCLTGYPPRDLLERPAFIDDNLRALEDLARKLPIATVLGFVDRVGQRLRNAAAVIADGRIASVHHKSLLPTYDVFDEWRYFEPAQGVELASIHGVRFGVSICEDIWNDADFWPVRRYRNDPIAESVALGARVLVNISASPFAVEKRGLRTRMLGACARKHGRPLIMVNQVGGNDDLVFDGGSMAVASDGILGARAREFETDTALVDVDLETGAVRGTIAEARDHDARGDTAATLDALVLGTRDYVRKCGFERVILGLSGGIDSALTAAIAARALGPDNVLGVSLPSRYSSEHSRSDAADLAENLSIGFHEIAIEGSFQAALDALAPIFAERAPDHEEGVAEENLQARARGLLLMALSNKLGHMLLTTGNKSELAVGYCTLYGDMCGGLAVISDVPKTLVYQLAHEFNRQMGFAAIPRSTLEKPPSAELRPGQRDQDSLPPYEVLDAILERFVEAHQSRDEIVAAGFDAATVDQILGLVRYSEYKRSQAAPGIKVRGKSFGPGRRMPLAARWR